jgi:GT2 family glycosyltransferase
MSSVAVLMTSHNRREDTLRCLRSLQQQPLFEEHHLFLVDDGSVDGTGDAVRALLPCAQVIAGSGDLFWNGGMRLAWQTARACGRHFDFYLWLNDDVTLRPGALANLVADARSVAGAGAVIVAGCTVAPGTDVVTYGGQCRAKASRPLRLRLKRPCGVPVPVDTFSGNVVLVAAAAERALGNLSPAFKHIFGDLDYGFRARAAGIPVVLASEVAGECDGHAPTGTSLDANFSRWRRLRLRLLEDQRLHARDWRVFARKHSGLKGFSFLYSLTPYLRLLLSARD